MQRLLALSALIVAAVAAPSAARVNKFATTGAYLQTGAPDSEPILAKGSFNTDSDVLKVRVKCGKGCPIRGRIKTTCTVGEGFYFVCEGGNKKCRIDGTLYQSGFEGRFTCGERSGAWIFGNP